ncbi:MAG: anthranilate synthase component I family protein [Sedimentisphaerales bacterium]|nr:anthranilate synthase component I family protein [Sedimentisphaerales bacterium]
MTVGIATSKDKSIACKLHYRKITAPINLPALSEVFAGRKSASILGGNMSKADADRFSYWVCEPKDVFEFRAEQKYPFQKLHRALSRYRFEEGHENALPKGLFCGGWIGYLAYELGRYIEKLPATTIDDVEMPLIRLCFYDRVIAYDHLDATCWLIALDLPGDTEEPEDKLADLGKLVAESQTVHVEPPVAADLDRIDFSAIRSNMSKDYYLRAIAKIKHYIYEGDIYQVNFSQRFECDFDARPIDLFHWQNYYNPSPYAAYIDAGQHHIVSASPEMFITIRDGAISTKPIKGTRPRLNQTESAVAPARQINAKNFNELLHSEKEQAELNMIIDLERNDVAKICEPGTRKVVQPRTIEDYPTVFHAVATVAGQLRRDVTFCDVLKAMFPGGSITGAPKIRSMEIIDETEPTARGVYTGSIGFIGIDGAVCFNIAIRTIIITNHRAYAQTGGGIVADSDPEAEWDETITKAKALIAGITATQKPGAEHKGQIPSTKS